MNPAIFSVGDREFSLAQVWSAAEFRGEAEPVREAIQDCLCCSGYAEEEGFEAYEEALQAAADGFRLQRDLLTAEATESWLRQRRLTADDFGGWVERTWWLGRFSADVPRLRSDYLPPDNVVAELVWPQLVLTGALARLASGLAIRVTAAAEFKGPIDSQVVAAAKSGFFKQRGLSEKDLAAWLHQVGCNRTWFEELAVMEAICRHPSFDHVEPERLQAALISRRTSLTKVELELARLGSLDAAQEARLSVIEDGERFGAVCRSAGTEPEVLTSFIEDLPLDLQPAVLSAAEGETLKPVGLDAGFVVCHVRRKTDPGLDSPEVLERVKRPLLEAAHEKLLEKNVRWHVPLD